MTDRRQEEIDAAFEYAKNATNAIGPDAGNVNASHFYAAFLAGVEWQKHRPPYKLDREYYGF